MEQFLEFTYKGITRILKINFVGLKKSSNFATAFKRKMVGVAQLVRVPDCGSEGRGFESHLPPVKARDNGVAGFLFDRVFGLCYP